MCMEEDKSCRLLAGTPKTPAKMRKGDGEGKDWTVKS